MSIPVSRPAPPVPADLDLRDFRWMKLDLVALFNSEFNSTLDDSAWRAGVTLWGKAWHQVPAGSLPNDDGLLCHAAGLGRDVKAWRKIKAIALHGFTECSDGRLYHGYVCKMAAEADAERRRFEARKSKDRERKKAHEKPVYSDGDHGGVPSEKPPHDPPPSNGSSHGIPVENAVEGQGQGQGQGEKERTSSLRSDGAAPPRQPSPSDQSAPPDPRKRLWSEGLRVLRTLIPSTEPAARKQLGRLLDAAGGDPERLMAVLKRAEVAQPSDPMPWLMAAVKPDKPGPDGLFGDDPWGLRAWISRQPDVRNERHDGQEKAAINGFVVEMTGVMAADAAGLPKSWRGNWDALGAWMREDLCLDDRWAQAIAAQATRMREAGQQVRSMQVFDAAVRAANGRQAA